MFHTDKSMMHSCIAYIAAESQKYKLKVT